MHGMIVASAIAAGLAGSAGQLAWFAVDRAVAPAGMGAQPEPGGGVDPGQPGEAPLRVLLPEPLAIPPMIEVRPPITVGWDPRWLAEEIARQAWLDSLASSFAPVPASLDGALRPVERDGLLASVTSVSASATLQQTTYGSGSAQIQRSISINGSVCDLSGTRSFRIVGQPRLVEFTDETGASLLSGARWQAYPNGSSSPGFTRPEQSPGSVLQQAFSLTSDQVASIPRIIGTLRIELVVAVAEECQEFEIRGESSRSFQTLAPGIEVRVATMAVEGGSTHMGVEYRLTDTCEGGASCFVSAEVLDDERRVLGELQVQQEAETRTSVMGTAAGWGLDTRRGPAWTIRLRFVPAAATRRMEILEQNVPLLGG